MDVGVFLFYFPELLSWKIRDNQLERHDRIVVHLKCNKCFVVIGCICFCIKEENISFITRFTNSRTRTWTLNMKRKVNYIYKKYFNEYKLLKWSCSFHGIIYPYLVYENIKHPIK